ncbi:hypothetical protein [Streptomyces sp. NPDC006463]|uniref:hypothetical protein n=1 Tax=Streptomyces sp. NPDC006463 TaxID=3364746 RepID=UPI00367B8006
MHTTLTEHARCVWGDEYGPTPECEAHGLLPVWVRNLAYRLILLQRPHDPAMMREAALNLEAHGPSWDDIAEDLRARADALAPAGAKPWGHAPG